MPRARRTAVVEAEEDFALPGLDQLDQDPTPAAAVPRPRRSSTRTKTAAGNRGRIAARSSSGRIQSKTAQVNQVRAELETYLTLSVAAWSLRDPECAYTAEQAIPAVADKVAAMIARNDALLAVVTKSGIVGDVIGLLTALLPVVRTVWAAHGPGGHGHDPQGKGADDAATFPAYSR